jgi:hypothetical protein
LSDLRGKAGGSPRELGMSLGREPVVSTFPPMRLAWLACLFAVSCGGSVSSSPQPQNDAGADAATPDAGKDAEKQDAFDAQQEPAPLDAADVAVEEAGPPQDIYKALQAIPGMEAHEQGGSVPGCRFFNLVYQQPIYHQDGNSDTFGQRMALIHCNPAAPTILGSTGYTMWSEQDAWELTAMFGGNQIVVEHRFFEPSIPSTVDWEALTIQNAAADHHRIVQALRPLYTGKWLSTGASKGGMTSVYHRRFYPDDVDGTVAYVAPHSKGIDDDRYPAFLEQVGDPTCRQAIKDFEREALVRKQKLLVMMKDNATQNGLTYDRLGEEKAFEHAVTELWFYFWQYYDASQCSSIPGPGEPDDSYFKFLNAISPLDSVADATVEFFTPYFWQAAVQLGAPKQADAHLVDLLTYPGSDVPATYGPPGWDMVFDPAAMQDVGNWLTTQGSRMMFIYGENDPWSAAAFELGNAKDSYKFYVPAGNHYSQIQNLQEPYYSQALAALASWTGAKPKPFPPTPHMLKTGRRPRL